MDDVEPTYTPEEEEKIYQVRLLIADSPSSPFYPLFDDDEIASFLKMNGWNVRRASRQAAIAASMNFSQMVYRERTGDIEVWNNVSIQYLKALENVIKGNVEDFGALRPYFGGVDACRVRAYENDPRNVRSPLVKMDEKCCPTAGPVLAIKVTEQVAVPSRQSLYPVGDIPLSPLMVVALDNQGRVIPADVTNEDHFGRLIGVIKDTGTDGKVEVFNEVVLNNPEWNFSQGRVFLGTNGQVVQQELPEAKFTQIVGASISFTSMLVSIVAPSGTVDEEFLLVGNRLSEFSTAQAKVEARQNLELQHIDSGTFN